MRSATEEQQTDLSFDGRPAGHPLGRADGAVVVDPLYRREQLLEQHRDVVPALLVEHRGRSPDLRVGVIESARDARIGRLGDNVSQRARERLASKRGRQLRPLLSVEQGVGDGAVVVLERTADLARAHQLDAVELLEDADVVRDVGHRRVEQAGELRRAGLAAPDAQSFEDALAQWVRERLGEIRIEWPIPSGIRAGGRHWSN